MRTNLEYILMKEPVVFTGRLFRVMALLLNPRFETAMWDCVVRVRFRLGWLQRSLLHWNLCFMNRKVKNATNCFQKLLIPNKPGGFVCTGTLRFFKIGPWEETGGDFIGPVLADELNGLMSGRGIMYSLSRRTEPNLPCWIKIRSFAASNISPME